MPKVLPIFPLYPSPTFLQYNVSLAIPGPKLWDLPKIGDFAKKNNYPNTQSAILIPDIEYIRRFANYELGISDSLLKSAQQQNIARIKDPKVRETFDQLYGQSSSKTGAFKDGIGLASIEKTILSSIFETQKPYFEIAQFVIKSLSKIEDIIARICPLIGAATNPALALAIKSRKPKGNGPQQGGILGPYGTPPALGYKNSEEVLKKLDSLSTQLQKGDGFKIDKSGKYTKVPKKFLNENNKPIESFDNIIFTYATISTIYSTGIFDPNVNYTYKYVDIDSDQELPEFITPPEEPEIDYTPDRIVLGIFNKNGTAIDPNSKVQYWGVNYSGLELEKKDSIFEKAPWIKSEKWIFDKSIDYRNTINWQTLDSPIYSWKKNGQVVKQKNSPGDGWDKIKYKDVINFDKEENQYLKYLEDDFFVEFETSSINEYREYYLYLTEQSFEKNKVPAEDRPEILQQVEKLFSEKSPNDKIVEQLRNLIKYGDFKSSYYGNGIDTKDWTYNSTAPNDQLPNELRRVFKPMRFDIDGRTVWIDPEGDYDIKVIKIDPILRLKYNDSVITTEDGKISANKSLEKNSNIKTFIKNRFTIKVFSKSGNLLPFSIDVSRGDNSNTYRNLESYDLVNWNVYFDNVSGEKYVTNSEYNFKVYFESSNIPSEILQIVNIPYMMTGRYYPDSDYDNGPNTWESPNEDISNRFREIGLGFLADAIDARVESVKLEKTDIGITRLVKLSSSFKVEKLTYKYWKKKVINPFALAESIALGQAAVLSGILTLSGISLIAKSIEKLDDAIDFYRYYTIETSTTNSNVMTLRTVNLGSIKLELINGIINKWVVFELGVDNETSINGTNILPLFFKQNTLSINLGSEQIVEGAFDIYIPDFLSSSISVSDLPRFQIELNESGSSLKLINSKDYNVKSILNKNLQDLSVIDKLYSKGRYGAGWKGGPCFDNKNSPILDDKGNPIIEPDNPQFIGYNRRSQMTELDLEPYYIIEAYKRLKNEEDEDKKSNIIGSGSSSSGSGGGGFYRMPAAVGITKVMIELTIDLSVKLFPAINKLISLIKNPASFVTSIIQSKLEDHFIIFSPRVTEIMSQVDNFRTRFKSASTNNKSSILDEMKKFVKSSELGNYLYVNDDADFKFVIDGPALIGFFGILFGLDLNLTKAFNGGIPIKPIFSTSPSSGNIDQFFNDFEIGKNKTKSIFGDQTGKTDDQIQKELEDKVIKNLDLTKPDESIKNKIVSKNGEADYYEEVTTTYSTGKFIKGVDYKYIYITQQVEQVIREADELINKTSEIDFSGTASNPLDSLQLASDKYQQAYDMIDKNDNTKDSLKKLLLDKIKALKSKINIVSQPLFKLVLGIVTLPLKVVFSIIKWLIDFFKKLVNPIKFPGLIAEFLSFKWIMQFFTPKGLLELAGIKFKPEKLIEWCVAVNAPNPLFGNVPNVSRYLIPDDYVIADLNEFLNVGFGAKLPVYTAKQYRDLCLRPFRLFSTFLCFIEKIINSFIMLIWSVMGITAVIPPPLVKLCKRLPENIDPKDLRDLIDGMYKDDDLSVVDPKLTTEDLKNPDKSTGSYDFIYEVKLPDGSVKKDLDRESVQKLIEQNKGLDFDFLNFETLE